MKELAILGSSNLVIAHGFGQYVKSVLGDECDLYFSCRGTSVSAILELLKGNIINHYKYVVLDLNMHDTSYLSTFALLTPEKIIAYVLGIMNLFKNSKSIPVFLVLPVIPIPRCESALYIYKSISSIYNIPIINCYEIFNYTNFISIAPRNDSFHFHPKIQQRIGDMILKLINGAHVHNTRFVELPEITFSLMDIDRSLPGLKSIINSTSILSRESTLINLNYPIKIPEDQIIIAVNFWILKERLYIRYKNLYLSFAQPLFGSAIGDNTVLVGSIYKNMPAGGNIEISSDPGALPLDSTPYMEPTPIVSDTPVFHLNDIILCEQDPYAVGQRFLASHKRLFNYEKYGEIINTVANLRFNDYNPGDFIRVDQSRYNHIETTSVGGDRTIYKSLSAICAYLPPLSSVLIQNDYFHIIYDIIKQSIPSTAVITPLPNYSAYLSMYMERNHTIESNPHSDKENLTLPISPQGFKKDYVLAAMIFIDFNLLVSLNPNIMLYIHYLLSCYVIICGYKNSIMNNCVNSDNVINLKGNIVVSTKDFMPLSQSNISILYMN